MYPVKLETKRLLIRELSFDDAPSVFAYASLPEVNRFMPWPKPKVVEDLHGFLHGVIRQAHEIPRTSYDFAIEHDGELIGSIGLHSVSESNGSAELGYILRSDHWNKGIMTEAVTTMLRFGFIDLKLQRISALHAVGNDASGVVLRNCGMTHEGRLRSHLNIHGERFDSECFAILAIEFGDTD